MKTLPTFAAAAALSLLAAVPSRASDISVCIWGTITGPDALVNGMAYGPRDYLEFLNQTQGGIAGVKVKTLLLDGRYKLDEELKDYRRCVEEEQAVVVVGWSTGSAKALRDQVTQDGVTFAATTYASEVLDPKKYPFVFMFGPTYEQQLIVALRDLKARGGKTVAIMNPDNEYGRSPVALVKKSGIIESLGLTLADTVEFSYDAQDLTAQLLRVKAKNPDMVYVQASTPQVIVALRDAAKIGMNPTQFVGNMYNYSPAIPKQLGAAAEGFRAIQIYSDYGADIPASKDIAAFKAKNTIVKEDIYYMKGWFEGMSIAKAIGNAIAKDGGKVPDDLKTFRAAVRDQFEALHDLDTGGIVPQADFANHQGTTRARLSQIKDGKYVEVGDWIDAR